ncbi:MAG: heme oxygenase [Bacteroidetes bacterium 24-39-8]|nr:MAG: heme oxygenase [Sphingobacteriia bacterium 35-40-8]OYZ51285.1 MAG: heme oxygenase [Bacteroidetes bacterium 24-39-8]OZA66912.1 MAG: heme oxygenase [Sphingobacteriia bacterium 39-39-8]HQR93880.1 DUF3050 domain-containing protein [Sediminibacterium sp.]HQS56094.1 DUF3050 domain-containing protein [Sediminibacterium sp.]
MNKISELKEYIAPTREKLLAHPLYAKIQNLKDLQTFSRFHVFAVWDFMSLLKSLQNNLTCTTIPWHPKGSANTRFLINEIVTGEESDVDAFGKRTSHFELYLSAMEQMGASQKEIQILINLLSQGLPVSPALDRLILPAGVRDFLNFTFDIIQEPIHVQAAVFSFGREDLIPDMFLELLQEIAQLHPEKLDGFIYYLQRHIEIDGGHHSHLAMEMVAELCGDDNAKWKEASVAAIMALEKRIQLWDAILDLI